MQVDAVNVLRQGASCTLSRLSVSTDGDALFSIRGDSRVGPLARKRPNEARLVVSL